MKHFMWFFVLLFYLIFTQPTFYAAAISSSDEYSSEPSVYESLGNGTTPSANGGSRKLFTFCISLISEIYLFICPCHWSSVFIITISIEAKQTNAIEWPHSLLWEDGCLAIIALSR